MKADRRRRTAPTATLRGVGLACLAAGAAEAFLAPFRDPRCHYHPTGDDARPSSSCLHAATALPRVVEPDGPLAALEYVDKHDYMVYDVFEGAERWIIQFECWAADNGIQRSDGFKLVEEKKGKEAHAVTKTDAAAGQPVLYVPEHLILSSNKAMAELRCPEMLEAEQFVVQKGGESQARQWYLMLKVLYEIQKGRDSPWHGWLNAMPRYYENAASMTDLCLQCLPPLMRKQAEEERERQRRLSRDTIDRVPFLSDDLKHHPRDFCKWAYQIVHTRAFETEDGDLRIVPMADFFNHGSDYTEVEPYYDEYGNYYAYATYDVPAGSSLRMSYADPRNPAYLLARYGFFDENCPASYCKLLPPTVNQDMLDLGYSHERMLFYRTGEVSDEVWDIFLYCHLAETNDLEGQQALMASHRSGDFQTKLALHEKHYAATSSALLQHVDGILEEIDRVIKKSEANEVYIKNEHPRLPLIHRHNQFVRETFQNVRNRYTPMYGNNYNFENGSSEGNWN